MKSGCPHRLLTCAFSRFSLHFRIQTGSRKLFLSSNDRGKIGGVVPRYDFDPKNGKWGAFELAGRLSSLSIDNDHSRFQVYF